MDNDDARTPRRTRARVRAARRRRVVSGLALAACGAVWATNGCKVASRDDFTFVVSAGQSSSAGSAGTEPNETPAGGSDTHGAEGGAGLGGSAGTAGNATLVVGGGLNATAGSGGAPPAADPDIGGMGGANEPPCTPEGLVRCVSEAEPLRKICKDGIFELADSCAAGENCDGRDASCGPILPACAGRRPGARLCEGDTLITCGADLLTLESTACEGRCIEATGTADCAPPTCGDGAVQNGEQCDDKNTASGDGCSRACKFEPAKISAGGQQVCAIGTNAVLKCWGDNREGELGLGDRDARGELSGELGEALKSADLGMHTVQHVSTGFQHTCVVLEDGSVRCFGLNDSGRLGHGDLISRGGSPSDMGAALPITQIGGMGAATAVVATDVNTCVLLSGGRVKCWGGNAFGQLGIGDVQTRGDGPNEMGDMLPAVNLGPGRTAKRIALGHAHVCAILDTDLVKCWGNNADGQLGQGDVLPRGDDAMDMGSLFPIDLGMNVHVRDIAAGLGHTCALLDDGSVKCWGANLDGQLGLGDRVARGDGPSEMGAALAAVSLGRKAVAIVAGQVHTCALLDDGSVKCWGHNAFGQLGLGDVLARGDAPGEMGNALPAVNLGSGRGARMLAAARYHTCALLDEGSVRCWGLNDFGQLGTGDTKRYGDEMGEMGDQLPPVDLRF